MDYLPDQACINVSSETDEGESRAQKTVTAVIDRLDQPQAKLLRLIKNTFRIPDSLIGLLTVIKETVIDFRCLNKFGIHCSGLMYPDTDLGENARDREVFDE